jgi:hypothetical protein
VSPKRKDYRGSIDSIYIPEGKFDLKTKEEFIKSFEKADILKTESKLYAWWD